MKLKALDQIHVSAVQSDSLRAGQEFEVGDDLGRELLTRHPNTFEEVPEAPEPAPEKAARRPRNKAAPKAANKKGARPRNKAG